MTRINTTLKSLICAGAIMSGLATAAIAAECPANKVGVDVTMPTAEAHAPIGVTDTVLASIDVAKEPAAIAGRSFRIRKLTVQPGGIVPWHDHANRPALIYILEGQITEYSSNCAVPLEHKAGDVSVEDHTVKHWWKNNSHKPTVLISDDLFPVEMKDDHMM
jgi:quercetin dioxygenase-like cupin family protein